jgi:hypothetical protein
MKNSHLLALTLSSLLVGLVAISAEGQAHHICRVNIPFGFTVRGRTLPPGEYLVKPDPSSDLQTFTIRALDGDKVAVSFTTINATGKTRQSQSMLVFNRYRDQYFLSQIWEAGERSGRELPKSRKERHLGRELARGSLGPQTVPLRSTGIEGE